MTCPIPGCTATPRAGELLCGPHWRQVPSELKGEIWTAWRALRYGRDQRIRAEALPRYRAARSAAIAAVSSSGPLL